MKTVTKVTAPTTSLPLAFSAAGPMARQATEATETGLGLHSAVFRLKTNEQTGEGVREVNLSEAASNATVCYRPLVRNTTVPLELEVSAEQYTALFGSSAEKAEEDVQLVTAMMEQIRMLSILSKDEPPVDLSPCATLSNLRALKVVGAASLNLAPLAECRALQRVEIKRARDCVSFAPLKARKALRKFGACETIVKDDKDITTCTDLTEVAFTGVGLSTETVEAMSACKALRVVKVNSTDLTNVVLFSSPPELKELDVSSCESLTGLAPLAGCSSLRKLYASYSGVNDLEGLATCPAPKRLHLSGRTNLESLAPLAGCHALHELHAWPTNVSDITGLCMSPALEVLSLDGYTNLVSLAPLAGCPSLWSLSARGSVVEDVTGLDACSTHNEVDLDNRPLGSTVLRELECKTRR